MPDRTTADWSEGCRVSKFPHISERAGSDVTSSLMVDDAADYSDGCAGFRSSRISGCILETE